MLGNGVQGYQRGLWLEAYGWEFKWPELGTKSVSHKRLLAFQGEGRFRCKITVFRRLKGACSPLQWQEVPFANGQQRMPATT
jgi:hypothetical protein